VTAPRVVSLVPSITSTVAALGKAEVLVGVTRYCVRGPPDAARRVGGTKNPDVSAIVDLRPDVVLANAEENRDADITALRAAGLDVRVFFPKAVADIADLIRSIAEIVGADSEALLADLADAEREAATRRPATPVPALTLVWRRPWMGLGPDTYADDLLARCGFANVLTGFDDRYPRLDPALQLGPQVVLLPSEPYAFTADDLDGVRGLVGDKGGVVPCRFVDGQLLTWHGADTAKALRTFAVLASDCAATAANAGGSSPG
jgi:ABC-type Fe3+-hydroxamate transport system substrate-binding protein